MRERARKKVRANKEAAEEVQLQLNKMKKKTSQKREREIK